MAFDGSPIKSSAAVNVSGSVELARYCGIRHVVIISDACRVAPEGLQAQGVRGIEIVPNDSASDRARPVDQFFACFLGRTAAEIKDPEAAAGNYSALYTNALLDALMGARPEVLEAEYSAGDDALYVKPWTLQAYLEAEVPRRVRALQLQHEINQNPDAIITSKGVWLSRISRPSAQERTGSPDVSLSPSSLLGEAGRLVQSAAAGDPAAFAQQLRQVRTGRVEGAVELAETVDHVAGASG